MPPRHAYWTILVDDQPTAFRAHDAEELLATLNRLKQKHPSAVMKWFERGKLWASREAAREEGFGQGERRWEGPRPGDPPRDRSWRPGGEHRDPRQKYKDAKKAKWTRFKKNIRDRSAPPRAAGDGSGSDARKFSPPHGDPLREHIDGPRGKDGRRETRDGTPSRPHGDAMRPKARPAWKQGGSDRRDAWKPKGPPRADRPRGEGQRGGWQRRDDTRPGAWKPTARSPQDREHRDWRDRPNKPRTARPFDKTGDQSRPPDDRERRDWRDRPNKPRTARPFEKAGDRKRWGSKPPGSGRPKAGGKPGGGRGPQGPRGPRGPRPPRKPRDDE